MEEGIIASLNRNPSFKPSSNWSGLNSPVKKIANSGLWNIQGLDVQPQSYEELERVKWLARFGKDCYGNNIGQTVAKGGPNVGSFCCYT